ncbi:unnamed protein product [Didymodactylos carnosus]|uniref:Uncharacterized protein n=1 Tax=Didymodactylos carnosus TaxID=1234261 RepID=A0A8S2DK50_9BILA|nr:unnamed protein product [Didymodactylos carnosus]CAF3761881.1 unnamed protein product [Didymodactylos carnosus]
MTFVRNLAHLKQYSLPLFIRNQTLVEAMLLKHLGLSLTPTLSWDTHVSEVLVISYGSELYSLTTGKNLDKLQSAQYQIAITVTGAMSGSDTNKVLKDLGWLSIRNLFEITYYTSRDQSFECSSISHCATIDSIQNPEIRRQLFQRYKDIAEQSRLKMFQLYLKTAEEERNRCKKKYDTAEKKMWMDRRLASDDEKIPPIMINLIEQRCSKMSNRIKCIYQYKAQSIGIESHSSTK